MTPIIEEGSLEDQLLIVAIDNLKGMSGEDCGYVCPRHSQKYYLAPRIKNGELVLKCPRCDNKVVPEQEGYSNQP